MAYTIQFLPPCDGGILQAKVNLYLALRLQKEGVFRATLTPFVDRKGLYCIRVKPVRLIKAKEYCGNHPGECVVGGKKMKATYLEWNDWVKFHNLVNRVLNRFHANANVWSTPADVYGKMWIRKGTKARVKWEWTERGYDAFGRPVRIWNVGSDDQFLKED